MGTFVCKVCGNNHAIEKSEGIYECDYCGTTQVGSINHYDKKSELYDRANELRRNYAFEKAAILFENILYDFPNDSEIYWQLALCKYGVNYVFPVHPKHSFLVCHRKVSDSILYDENYEKALRYANQEMQAMYEEEAKKIDQLQKAINEIGFKEDPFDVYLCCKGTESVVAQNVYNLLTEKGYNVFFHPMTLENTSKIEYEAYIFHALNTAKVMLAIISDEEDAWTESQWLRFISTMKNDQLLIPCYLGSENSNDYMEFENLHKLDWGNLQFSDEVLSIVSRIIPFKQSQVDANLSLAIPLLKRAKMYLEDEYWSEAGKYFEDVLIFHPKCGEAYAGLFLASKHLSSYDTLFIGLKQIIRAFRPKEYQLDKDLNHIQQMINQYVVPNYLSKQQIEEVYNCTFTFSSIIDSLKNQVQIEERYWNIKEFEKIEKYADGELSKTLINIKKQNFDYLNEAINNETMVFNKNKEEAQQKYQAFLKEADQKVIALYQKAKLTKNEDEHCQSLFKVYKAEKNQEIRDELKNYAFGRKLLKTYDSLTEAMVGDDLTFGTYKKSPVEWLVLDKQDHQLLLISKYALSSKSYNFKRMDVSWETSELRKWLNKEFINDLYLEEFQDMIVEKLDKIFLLSSEEAKTYFSFDSERICQASPYPNQSGSWVNQHNRNCRWWLRTSGYLQNCMVYVNSLGEIVEDGCFVDYSRAIRPCMWLDLNQ